MEFNVKRSKLDSNYDPDSGVRCLLYEARKNLNTQISDEVMLKDKLEKTNPKFALPQIMSPGGTNLQETTFTVLRVEFSKFSAILTQCLEQTVMLVMMTKMLYLHFLHFLCDILNSTKSQMV